MFLWSNKISVRGQSSGVRVQIEVRWSEVPLLCVCVLGQYTSSPLTRCEAEVNHTIGEGLWPITSQFRAARLPWWKSQYSISSLVVVVTKRRVCDEAASGQLITASWHFTERSDLHHRAFRLGRSAGKTLEQKKSFQDFLNTGLCRRFRQVQ